MAFYLHFPFMLANEFNKLFRVWLRMKAFLLIPRYSPYSAFSGTARCQLSHDGTDIFGL